MPFSVRAIVLHISMAEQLVVTGLENWLTSLVQMCYLPLLILLILLPIHISNSSQSYQVKKGPGVSDRFHYAFPKSLMETLPMRIKFHNSQSTLTFNILLNIPYNYLWLIYLMVISKLSLRHRKVKCVTVERTWILKSETHGAGFRSLKIT